MKKTISFLLALMAVASMNLGAFAMEGGLQNDLTTGEIMTEVNNNEVGSLSLGTAENSELSLSGLIAPNQSLRFPILINENGASVPLTEQHMENHRLRVSNVSNKNAVRSVKVVEDNGTYLLEVNTLLGYPTDIQEYSAVLDLLEKSSGKVTHNLALNFAVGYNSIPDDMVEGVANGEFIFIDNNTPVITEEQFERMDKLTNGGKVTITNGDWTYEVRVGGQKSVNLLHNERAIKEIVSQFEDQDFRFLSFVAGPAFDFTGSFTLDVSEELEQWEEVHLYSYYNGKLNKVYTTLNEDDGTLSFKSKYTGRFVLTDKAIKSGTVVENCDESCDNISNNSGSTTKPNPSTGADSIASAAAAMAILSGGASLLLLKKDRD